MRFLNQVALVTGGGSGLGLASVRRLLAEGAQVIVADLPTGPGAEAIAQLSGKVRFVSADVTDAQQVREAVENATAEGPLRLVVHTAGRGGAVRFLDKAGRPGDAGTFESVIRTNLLGTFHVIAAAASAMSSNDLVEGERGSIVLTASVAAFEPQIGQAAYGASKAGVVGMTLCAARDLASRGIRVSTIAPGVMDTPMLSKLRDDVRSSLERSVPQPPRFGTPEEFSSLAMELLSNRYLNGETVRLDGAIRMAPR